MKFTVLIFSFLLILINFGHSQEKYDLKLPGWQLEEELLHYTADNLWEYINGAADQFLSYDFQNLQSGDYKSDSMGVTIDIYNMETPLNAFGIFNVEKPKNRKSIKIGTKTVIVPPYQILQLKDKYYIKCNIFDGKFNESTIIQLMKNIASSLGGSEKLPVQFNELPKINRIAGSESYIKEGYQGLSELKNCVGADYKNNEQIFQYFLVFHEGSSGVTESWAQFSQKWKKLDLNEGPGLYKKIPYKGYLGIVQNKNKIYGVTNCSNMDILKQRLNKLLEELK